MSTMRIATERNNILRKGVLLLCALFPLIAMALDIPAGVYYFDNSKTGYANVKFVYGSNNPAQCMVMSMTEGEDDIWMLEVEETVTNQYRYFFSNTSYADGVIHASFNTVKDDVAKNRGEQRTATIWDGMPNGYVYTPENGNQWAQGSWINPTVADNNNGTSGTLPVVYLNTENHAPIVSKEEYLNAGLYIDGGNTVYGSYGSEAAPVAVVTKGRGNYTWTGFEKKPYKIKLKQSDRILGMGKSKHYTLLAHADDDLGFLRNTVGFELSRFFGLNYTPKQIPVELMLNGEYRGLYFLTEQIKIGEERLNIIEQEDGETDALAVSGGWLIEIDNYDDEYQFKFEGHEGTMRFTHKKPEELSVEQRKYMSDLLVATDNAIHQQDKDSRTWEEYIDLDTLVNYYLVQEVMDDAESFHGSCYIHKDRGYDTKLIFGPVWDFGNSYRRENGNFIYQYSPFGQTWIGELAEYPRFQEQVLRKWNSKYKDLSGLYDFIDKFRDEIAVATEYDYRRWPAYGVDNMHSDAERFKGILRSRIAWLHDQWEREGMHLEEEDEEVKVGLYPNPTTVPQITIVGSENPKRCMLYDMTGKMMWTKESTGRTIDLGVTRGMYVLKIELESGATSQHKIVFN